MMGAATFFTTAFFSLHLYEANFCVWKDVFLAMPYLKNYSTTAYL
jgi:hypothetical protein